MPGIGQLLASAGGQVPGIAGAGTVGTALAGPAPQQEGFFKNILSQIQGNPNIRQAIVQGGLALTNPNASSVGEQLSGAIGSGVQTFGNLQERDRQQGEATEQREFQRGVTERGLAQGDTRNEIAATRAGTERESLAARGEERQQNALNRAADIRLKQQGLEIQKEFNDKRIAAQLASGGGAAKLTGENLTIKTLSDSLRTNDPNLSEADANIRAFGMVRFAKGTSPEEFVKETARGLIESAADLGGDTDVGGAIETAFQLQKQVSTRLGTGELGNPAPAAAGSRQLSLTKLKAAGLVEDPTPGKQFSTGGKKFEIVSAAGDTLEVREVGGGF